METPNITRDEIINETRLSAIDHFKIETIDDIIFPNFESMKNFEIERYLATRSETTIKRDFMFLSFFNKDIDFLKGFEDFSVDRDKEITKSRNQITLFLRSDNDAKALIRKIGKDIDGCSTVEKISYLFIAAERIAHHCENAIEISSPKNARLFGKVLKRGEAKKLISECIKTIKPTEFIRNENCLFSNFKFMSNNPLEIKYFDYYVRFAEMFLEEWYDYEEIENYDPKISLSIEEVYMLSLKRYGTQNLYEMLSQEDLAFFISNEEMKLERLESNIKLRELIKNAANDDEEVNIFRPKKEYNGEKLFVQFLEEKIMSGFTKDTTSYYESKDGIALSVLYYTLDLFIYCRGFKTQDSVRIVIDYINAEFAKNYDDAIKFYDRYVQVEEELKETNAIVISYDEFDRKLFKKTISLLEIYSDQHRYEETVKLLYRFNNVDSAAIKEYKKASRLRQDDKYTDYFKWNMEQVASIALACEFVHTENLKFPNDKAFNYIIESFLNETRFIDINREWAKYNESYNHFVKKMKDDSYELPQEEAEFYNYYIKEGTLKKIVTNDLNYFYYKSGDYGSKRRFSVDYLPEDSALLYASLKSVIDEEKAKDKDFPDEKATIYLRAIRRHIVSKKRRDFISSFEQSELELKDIKITKLSEELERQKILVDDKNKLIDKLKGENKALSKDVDKEVKTALKEAKKAFKQNEGDLKDELKELKERLGELEKKNASLEKYNKKLEEGLAESEDELSEYKLEDVIGDKKVVIVSGRFETQRALENKYPNNIKIINDSSFKKNVLTSADVILYLYNFSSHQLYYRVQSVVDTNSDYFVYCKYNNLDLIEKKLAKTIVNMG